MYKIFLSFSIVISFLCILSCNESPTGTVNNGVWKISGNILTDPDGNVYTTVKIGNQVWTVENLRATKYNDGTAIPIITDSTVWSNTTTSAYCWYKNSSDVAAHQKWGALYNWYAVNTGKLAPAGWRVPTDEDWSILENYLISNGYNWDGTTSDNKIGKSLSSQTDWAVDDQIGDVGNDLASNNRSGFSALPAGFRSSVAYFDDLGIMGCWWSSTPSGASNAWFRRIVFQLDILDRTNFMDANSGFSVRLLRD